MLNQDKTSIENSPVKSAPAGDLDKDQFLLSEFIQSENEIKDSALARKMRTYLDMAIDAMKFIKEDLDKAQFNFKKATKNMFAHSMNLVLSLRFKTQIDKHSGIMLRIPSFKTTVSILNRAVKSVIDLLDDLHGMPKLVCMLGSYLVFQISNMQNEYGVKYVSSSDVSILRAAFDYYQTFGMINPLLKEEKPFIPKIKGMKASQLKDSLHLLKILINEKINYLNKRANNLAVKPKNRKKAKRELNKFKHGMAVSNRFMKRSKKIIDGLIDV